MKALLKETPGPGLALRQIAEPVIANPDDVLFQVEYCAICVGETKVYEWNEWAANDPTLQLPTVLGHEVAGVVTEVGSHVSQVRPGDRITADPFIHCGMCYQCRSGRTNLCVDREIWGKRRGAFAEYAVLPERVICPLPDRISMQEAALLENLGIAVHAVEQAGHDPGDRAIVIGCGPIGIMAAQAMAAAGMNVIMTDLVDSRLRMAEAISGATVIDVRRSDYQDQVMDLTAGRGADFVIEAAATQSALDQAFDLVRDGGTVVTMGTFNQPVTFNPFFRMIRREIKLAAMIGRTWETWRRMVQLIEADSLTMTPLVSHVLPLEEYEQAFQLAVSPDVMKVLLQP